MWMLRLLPGMGPETKAPAQKDLTGKTVIKLKPSAALPPSNVNARSIVANFKEDLYAFHKTCGGRVDQIHALFCHIAEHNGKPPLPPQTMAALLELTMEEMKEVPCIVSDVSLVKAFEKMVKPDDTGANFESKVMVVVRQTTSRCNHATAEVEKLRGRFAELHAACGGSSTSLFTFFMDLLPEEHRGQYTQPMWNVMVMKCPQTTTVIPLDHFVACFRDSMDTTDTAESIIPVLDKHIALNKDPKAASEAAEKLKKSQQPPQVAPRAIEIVGKHEAVVKAFMKSCDGRVSQMHQLFCNIAEANGRQPLPPQAMAALLELTKEQGTSQPVKVGEAQLFKAFQKLVKEEDSEDDFTQKVVGHIKAATERAEHAESEIATLRPALTRLHERAGGACQVLYEFFSDLLPEDQRGQFSVEAFNAVVMRVNPSTKNVPIGQFLLSFQDSIDLSDNASKILPVLEKHIDKFDPVAAAADSS
mmetsp:Transcript_33889/g.66107  ORF Transcript_33889/g.66107 Transcript_33889/m.66107 type:complete len:474 (+) Transcript_33889:155-1576(+)|eukprot:CAMPEP_0173398508 /NCGR_PEP_ID=MMETSP1356-20130122/41847_1 /TAXON_ID=77927 ORGANISM="Hemiselmis virescens, Strain PCC157" /NCGR_SAMPLE_ID=MMETSP1356 /ASSEMBLY_ACC=CAM_ASM_000847 /LENGTH=473 /DNA_ID=CAMNT_0014358005 /DNA_START=106 /DNA_END=1527 /DNA_ORIENTATION=-